jgi:hypothetical protein
VGKFHEEKINVMRKYLGDIATNTGYQINGEIPPKKIDAAIKSFASGLDRATILGFYDTTVLGSGKNGYVFTDDKIYYLETLEKPKKLWYDDIKHLEIAKTDKKECDKELRITLNDGSLIVFSSCFLNKTPLMKFLDEMKDFDVQEARRQHRVSYDERHNFGPESGGLGIGNFQVVNNQFEEEKFHARQGHGFAAERANTLYDKLTGHDAKIVGMIMQKTVQTVL